MKLVATMPVRNEAWVLGLSLRAALEWCDEVCILDHASIDQSAAIVDSIASDYPGRVHFWREENPEWQEMRHRQFLLEKARDRGATHIAIVDADEVLSANLLPSIRVRLQAAASFVHKLDLPWACLARSIGSYYSEGPWFEHMATTAFRDQPHLHWASRNTYDFHHREPMGQFLHSATPILRHEGGLMHLQFVSERRLRAKQALYKMVEVIRWPGRTPIQGLNDMYGRAIYQSDPAKVRTTPVPDAWWDTYKRKSWLRYLHVDADPWQEAECRRLLAEYGAEKFAGLDLFGVV